MSQADNTGEEHEEHIDAVDSPEPGTKKRISSRVLIYMISAGIIVALSVIVLVTALPEKKQGAAPARITLKKQVPQKAVSSARQGAANPAKSAQDARFPIVTTAKKAPVATPPAVDRPAVRPMSRHTSVKYLKKRAAPHPALWSYKRRVGRQAFRAHKKEVAAAAEAVAIPQKPSVPDAVQLPQDTLHDARPQGAETIQLFIDRGWTAYYTQDNTVLLYRYFDNSQNNDRKLINTTWFLGGDDIVVFANAIDCPDRSMDTFAFVELDARTLKVRNGRARDVAEKGIMLKKIQGVTDQALYDKVCR